MEALILAGGMGTRLRPIIGEHQKVVAEVAGRPFLAHLLALLESGGITRTTLCTGYRADEVEALGPAFGSMELRYSRETGPLGTGGAVRMAVSGLGGGPFLILNGDSYCGIDLPAFYAAHVACPTGGVTMATVAVEDVARYGCVETDAAGNVTAFVEKGGRSGPGRINAGLYWMDRAALEAMPERRPYSLERDLFPALTDGRLRAFPAAGPFLDIGTPEAYARAEAFLRRK